MRIDIKMLRDYTEEDKLSPQAKVILDTIKAKVGLHKPISKEALVEQLDQDGALNTRQGAAKVLTYYMPRLIEEGIMDKERVVEPTAAKDPTEKAPAKAKGTGPKKAPAVAQSV